MIDWPVMGEGGVMFDSTYRTKLAFMAGEGTRWEQLGQGKAQLY